jgi:hypothetical protein
MQFIFGGLAYLRGRKLCKTGVFFAGQKRMLLARKMMSTLNNNL